ncbi:MAG: low specificity L-threonine aldolase [Bacteroidales bacterium]|jgi:threonine aldolase|nr:low specificity L-threonine aldolase [Bacteroidales bacterium]MCI2121756.1 low specificity L-threonine aldolase [Bacteroidales bacterium]MCI2145897.1 low specificity L-threonine aldolase [Bacteroidales bacterium]
MIYFDSDYLEGAHPKVIELLGKTNLEQTVGYGEDPYCEEARGIIRKLCTVSGQPSDPEKMGVHFLIGGTQTNTTVIASILRPHQGVLCCLSGHINVHESGAIESTGHKVLGIAGSDGKISAEEVREAYDEHWNDANHEHMVQPGMVYISNPTEYGTLYSKKELTDLHDTCRELHLPLFLDGARLGYGLMSDANDLTLPDLARLTDVFYIGGTKVGALFGEAVVITDPALDVDFRYIMKQRGGMLAKGRLLGLQFKALLEDGLYFRISKHADGLAIKLRDAFIGAGYQMLIDSPTNQQFPILPDEVIAKLRRNFSFEFWSRIDPTHSAVRFCTSWCTPESSVDALIEAL